MRFNMGLALSILGAAGSIYTYAAPSQQKMVKLVVEMSEEQAFFTVLEQGSSEGVSSLIENGFDVNQRLENGATPLFMAIFSVSTIGLRAVEIVKALIAHGARRDSTVEVDGRPVTPFTLVEILEEQLAAYAQTEGLPHDQHAAIGEIKQALSAIKALVRF